MACVAGPLGALERSCFQHGRREAPYEQRWNGIGSRIGLPYRFRRCGPRDMLLAIGSTIQLVGNSGGQVTSLAKSESC